MASGSVSVMMARAITTLYQSGMIFAGKSLVSEF